MFRQETLSAQVLLLQSKPHWSPPQLPTPAQLQQLSRLLPPRQLLVARQDPLHKQPQLGGSNRRAGSQQASLRWPPKHLQWLVSPSRITAVCLVLFLGFWVSGFLGFKALLH